MGEHTETVEGYVVGGGYIRKNARYELLENARDCALMGHCIESGYDIVTDDDRLVMLNPEATRQVVDSIETTDIEAGI